MSDLILNSDMTINSDTVIDDFIFRAGTLKVKPNSSIIINGSCIFDPTTSDDPIGTIHDGIKARLALESGRSGIFEGFYFYNEYKNNVPVFFPCLIISSEEDTSTASSFYGGEFSIMCEMAIELAFKREKMLKTADGTLSGRSLAEYYLYNTRELLSQYDYASEYVKIGRVEFEDVIREPREQNQTLYGFSLASKIEYMVGD